MEFEFPKLEALRLLSKEILADQVASLDHFAYDGGFGHTNNTKRSVSSTATCVLSLVATGSWKADEADKAKTKELLHYLICRTESAGLEVDNPFTTAWILEAVTALQSDFSETLDEGDLAEIQRKEKELVQKIENGEGGVAMAPYPCSAYLTQLAVRTLGNRGKLNDKLRSLTSKWAWSDLAKQLALIQAGSKSQDAFAVAYLLILVTSLTPRSSITPEKLSIQRTALKVFFDCQLTDGTWPLSRPLFHYPQIGNAYCFEYELLTQLLRERDLEEFLLDYLDKINSAVQAAATSGYRLAPGVRAWSSGHHPQHAEPESWATASVYHFFHTLDRLLSEAVRRALFRHVELPLPSPGPPLHREEDFASKVIDSAVTLREKEKSLSLKKVLWDKFVHPISLAAPGIAKGKRFGDSTPRSAIFFGPPGTSKTELSREIAKFLGWPFLSIDPSMLLRSGMNGIQVEANSIFRMLEQTEGVVVLFDEFDELVQDRESSRAEQPSRLLTTAMLPKLASIHKRGTLVFIIATNNIASFDLAIRRPGRFDRVLQIMPPTCAAKLANRDWGANKNVDIRAELERLKVTLDKETEENLGALTFSECNTFATDLATLTTTQEATHLLGTVWKNCTLSTKVGDTETETWAERCEIEKKFNT